MATLIHPIAQCVIIEGASWPTYECLLADFGDSHAARVAYDQGRLEIMAPSYPHERLKSLLTTLVEAIATGMDLDFESAGSTTFKSEDVGRGFEPDACFYVQHVAAVQGRTAIDLATDPPPDLVIEIDITHPSLDKMPIYTAIGVPEVWRYDGQQLHIYRLMGDTHRLAETSVVLAGVTRADVTHFLELSQEMTRAAWIRHIQTWAQTRNQC
jgi:Uma2 family endonuclease